MAKAGLARFPGGLGTTKHSLMNDSELRADTSRGAARELRAREAARFERLLALHPAPWRCTFGKYDGEVHDGRGWTIAGFPLEDREYHEGLAAAVNLAASQERRPVGPKVEGAK